MSVVGWIILVLLLGWILLQRAKIGALRRDLDTTRKDMYRASYDASERMSALERELECTKLEGRYHAGALKIGPYATVSAALDAHPRASEFLAAKHFGGTAGPGAVREETLADAAITYGLDLEKFLEEFSAFLADPDQWALARGGLQVQAVPQQSFDA